MPKPVPSFRPSDHELNVRIADPLSEWCIPTTPGSRTPAPDLEAATSRFWSALSVARLVERCAEQLVGQVLLVDPAVGIVVRVLVPLAVAQLRRAGVAGVADRLRRPQRAALLDLGQRPVDRPVAGVRLRRARKVGDS